MPQTARSGMVTWPRLADPTSFGPVLTLWDLLLLCPLSFCPRTVCCSASKRLPATACPPARLLPGHPPCPAAFCSPWAVLCCSWPQTHPPTYPPTTTGHLLGTPRKTPVPLPTLSGRPPGSDLRRRTWRFKTSTNSPAAWVGLSRVGDGDRDGDAAAVPGWAPPAPPAPGTKGRLCPSPAAPARGNPPLKPAQAPCPGPRHAAARANVLSEPEGAFRAGGQGRGGAAPPPHSAGGEPRGPGNHRAAPLRRPPLPGPTARPHGEGGGGGGGGGGGRAVS